MKRREFITLAGRLAAAGVLPASLHGCGGESGSSSTTNLSSVDARVASINDLQANTASANDSLQLENSAITGTSFAAENASTRSTTISSTIADFFNSRSPNDYLPFNHYLSESENDNVWQKLIDAQQNAYGDFEKQITKLLASFRLYDFESGQTPVSDTAITHAQVRSISQSALDADEQEKLNDTQTLLDLALETIQNAINSADNPSAALISAFNLVTSSLNTILNMMGSAGELLTLMLKTITNFFLEKLLISVTENLITDLTFDTKAETLLSLSKMSLAAASVLALDNIDSVDSASSSVEKQLVNSFMSSSDLMARLSLTWLGLAESMVTNTVSASTAEVRRAVETTGDTIEPDSEFITDLKSNAAILAVASFTIKTLLNAFFEIQSATTTDSETGDESTEITGVRTAASTMVSGSDADTYSFLFQTPTNTADQSLNTFTSENSAELQSTVDALFTSFVSNNEDNDESEDSTVQSSINEITSTVKANTRASASGITETVEEDAYNFASLLASLSFQFASNTEEDAASFAEMMATYAYNFTMDIEEDAYQFAMQGMEYGYLFASRGEEVGVMADRILWMAVQIGVMADRIGEMADRIVYTEQLIVYTEMLILDFGILIYGVIKQITNLILTGMALILDREWYTLGSEDLILSTIDKNVTAMLENMHEYSLAVLENQKALREITQDAIDTIDFSQTA